MSIRVTLAAASRMLFAAFFLFTSLYCLIAFMPFTYQQLVKGDVFPALTRFAHVHPALYVAVIAFTSLASGIKRSRLATAFWFLLAAAGAALVVHPVLAHLDNNITSLVWGLAFLLPVVCLSALDLAASAPLIDWPIALRDENRAVFHAAWVTAVYIALIYGVAGASRRLVEPHPAAGWFALGISILTHVLVFLIFFVLLNLTSVVAGWFPRPVIAQFILCHVLGGTLLMGIFGAIVFPALSFTGPASVIYAAAFSAAVTVFLASVALRRAARSGTRAPGGMLLAYWFTRTPDVSPWRLSLSIIAIGAIAAGIASNVSRMDWNFLFQKLTVLLIWIAAFRMFLAAMRSRYEPTWRTSRFLVCAFLVIPGYRLHERVRSSLWTSTGEHSTISQYLERWSGYDASFKLIHDTITPESRDNDFYRFLVRNTNIARSVAIAPVSVDFVPAFAPAPEAKPNIFMIVIDSLRRDYLSPYNAAVDFTPRVGEFARDAVVFENAFTHYGGTGMSEPSIWVGGMMPHKQYITPFAPMNALQKLLEAEKYTAYISRDPILQTVVSPWPGLKELDYGKPNGAYDLCESLAELDDKLGSAKPSGPVFAYTQPQNIHISVINRAGAKPISNENYGSFYAPYASRIRRLDGCFGGFIDKLKSRGLYESSIIILTADHGDSLGEQGRWGHAYTIYPEIVRIPLIMHLPERYRSLYHNHRGLAFSTDITPSLYYLTGHEPVMHNDNFGSPLFTRSMEEQKVRVREDYLIASSYAAVYGLLSGDGRRLSVADAVNYRDYAAGIGGMSSASEPLTGGGRTGVEKRIRQKVIALSDYYHFRAADH